MIFASKFCMDNRPNFPKIEEEVLSFWDNEHIFEKTLQKPSPRGRFVFFEGPPTANGRPGIHHVESRAFKDVVLRFRTMQGYLVERKAGWDTHGLPVELEVEKELGFTGKKDIEAFGIANFNKKCKESVWKYLVDWNEVTRRIGFWVDLEHPYVTYEPAYVESLWWVVKQIWDKGLLYQDHKVVPYCARCGTSLSSHELAQGYKEIEDTSVIWKFPLVSDPKTFLLAWTTTPWSTLSTMGLSLAPDATYVKVKVGDEYLIFAKARIEFVMAGVSSYEVVEEFLGEKLLGLSYEPLLSSYKDVPEVASNAQVFQTFAGDYVEMSEGTGIVTINGSYGEIDMLAAKKNGLPIVMDVDLEGKFTTVAGAYAGMSVHEAVPLLIENSAASNRVWRTEPHLHSYPHCWRCKTKLIYYAKDSWYIRMSSLRDTLVSENQKIHWEPAHIQEGRFGEWLREVKDWAFSRERYWGTPLPIWVCQECGEKACVGSFEELRSKALSDVASNEFDPHRPYVDEIELRCEKCGGTSRRVPEVCDVWFDSGAMPFAQWHYPFENRDRIDKGTAYPADYIVEAIDQTRGWFYTLLAVATLLGKERPYKHVICLGLMLDAKGKKMAKSIGNVVNPVETVNQYGADAVRWYMYTINQPGDSKRFDFKALDEMVKKVFMILWNVVSFYELYAGTDGTKEHKGQPTHILDRWILARLHTLIKDNTELLEHYKITEPARDLAAFINDLSTWYVRRSRDRFKGAEGTEEARDAVMTLRVCLLTLAKLMAPFTPFLADALYLKLGGGKSSVHLEDWPMVDPQFFDETLLSQMEQIRSVVSLALEKRAQAKMPVRQALSSATVTLPAGELAAELIGLIKDEINVKTIIIEKGEKGVALDFALTPELLREGTVREIIRRVNDLRKKSGLTIEDRIELYVESADKEARLAIEEHHDAILGGTLAVGFRSDAPDHVEIFRTRDADVTVGFMKANIPLEPGHPREAP